MEKMSIVKRIVSVIVCIALVLGIFVISKLTSNNKQIEKVTTLEPYYDLLTYVQDEYGYQEYYNKHSNLPKVEGENTYFVNSDKSLKLLKQGESVSFNINTKRSIGNLRINYSMQEGNEENCEISLRLNNEIPFSEAENIYLYTQWLCDKTANTDERGNNYSPTLFVSNELVCETIADASGHTDGPICFAFNEGNNIITITAKKNSFNLESITVFYAEEKENNPAGNAAFKGEPIRIEAEFPTYRNDSSILEVCERSSAATSPTFKGLQIWNTLGGEGYGKIGQKIQWSFDVQKSGLYELDIRFRQNYKSGAVSNRKIIIDSGTPNQSSALAQFPYVSDWSILTVGSNDKDKEFYLEKGTHTITVEVVAGNIGETANLAQKCLYELNVLYRKIIAITGVSPDTYRDYKLEKKLGEDLKVIDNQIKILNGIFAYMHTLSGSEGSETVIFDQFSRLLMRFSEDPECIPKFLSEYQSNLSTLSNWIQTVTNQPLMLDYLELRPKDNSLTKANASFLTQTLFTAKQFLSTFAASYGVIGSTYDDNSIEVWLSLGRDQYQIIKEHIDNDFTAKNNIAVNLKLVDGGILLQTVVAGIAPDVYMFCDSGTPVNFASRGAALNLKSFSDYDEVVKRFSPETLVPYTYDGGVYALPITQSYSVLFARDDILGELSLSIPKTWDDVYNMLTVLQKNNMEFGFNSTISDYAMLLYQCGGELYKNDGKQANITSDESLKAFEIWTKLFLDYELPLSYNFVNRFRTGDMPIGITDFSTFNSLEVSAPEIKGLWSMHKVPAMSADGKSVTISAGTGIIAMKKTAKPKEAWEFMKWWTGFDEQKKYAKAIEDRQGSSARFSTANIEAFNSLPWDAKTLSLLNEQRDTARSVPEVPGGYFMSRHINNAFRAIVYNHKSIRYTAASYEKTINDEIRSKRIEFGLEVN